MSRIAKNPIPLPKGVEVNVASGQISVKGPLGAIARAGDPNVGIERDGEQLRCKALGNSRHANAMSGTMRALVANMVTGVTDGFTKVLEIQGTGYRAQKQGDKVVLQLGFSHPVEVAAPPGINLEVDGTSRVVVQGIDKQLVGQVAANIRAIRPPEPYKGKGVRYSGEHVRRKAGKAGKR